MNFLTWFAYTAFFFLILLLGTCKFIFRTYKRIVNRSGKYSTVRVSNVTPVSLLEVKVKVAIKVIFGNYTVSKKYDPLEMAQIPKVRMGEGMLGTLFKVVLNDGSIVTMRKIREGLVKPAELENWVSFFGEAHDVWILPIEFSFWYGGEAYILYEYLCLGSLEELLHEREGIQFTPLSWEIRQQIALCAAMAVASIHSHITKAGEPLVCGVIKYSNIMIKNDFSACLSGYETPYLIPTSTMIRRNSGRVAPELTSRNNPQVFNRKTDVYSFGILLLELISGEKPTLTDLAKCAKEKANMREGLKDICDKRMTDLKENVIEMVGIAQRCISSNPNERPIMERVVEMISVMM